MTSIPARPGRMVQVAGAALVAILAVVSWFAWLGWDHDYQIDPGTGSASGPYEAWQVAGCAGTLLVVLVGALLGGVRAWPASAALTLGFTAAWTVDAAGTDESGLYGVGTILLLAGLSAATTVVSFVVRRLRPAVR
jgi:hypothetical protein